MRKTLLPLFSISLLIATTASAAEINVRSGLWEVETTSQLLQLASQIPPDQMQQLSNLARQYGFDVPEIQNGAAVSKVCVTKEMADQKTLSDFHHDESGCTGKNATRTGNSYKMDLVCSGPRVKGNARVEGTFTSPERFSGRTQFNGIVQGAPVNEQADVSGRWIGASCGTVKPPQ